MASAKGFYAGQRGAFYPGDVVQLAPTRWVTNFTYNVGWWFNDVTYHVSHVHEGCCIVVDRAVVQMMPGSAYSKRWYMFYQLIIPDGAVVWTTGTGADWSTCITDKTYSILPKEDWPIVYDQNMRTLTYNKENKMWL